MHHLKKALLVFAASCLLAVSGAMAQDPATTVKEGLKMLKDKLTAYGAPRVEGNELFFGNHKINGDFTVVDEVKQKLGANATVFVRQRAAFNRISTNVLRGDGQRAVGTQLDPNGAAYPVITKKQPFYGKADILGKPYETGYEPILDASNELIGIYFVGVPVTR